ncbi:hypothetical protein DK842_22650 [Chromobacterium phragmitis]|nr:hypothetical protein DK842_22650 [Chromobacterium phragmitis]
MDNAWMPSSHVAAQDTPRAPNPDRFFSEAEALEMGVAENLPPEARDEEEDARWAMMPFLALAIERMCVMAVLAEDDEMAPPLGHWEEIQALATPDGSVDPVLARAAADYLSALTTLASASGRTGANWHQGIRALYLVEGK